MNLKDKTKNQINVLHIFKENGVWMFNDEEIGLFKEPFVSSMGDIIEMFVDGRDKFKAFISHSPIHQGTLILQRIEDGMDGLYRIYDNDPSSVIGWLCPALLKYFEYYPKFIYVKIK